jgi:MFS-type transporter involved in bile tolerance (Atg22 family)
VHTYGRPVVTDAPVVIADTLLLVVVLALTTGAALLWIRTKHPAALIQLITASVIAVLALVEHVAKVLNDAQMPRLFEFIRQPQSQFAFQIIGLLCFVTFPAAYIWYAHNREHI